jgi:hypothetical protein
VVELYAVKLVLEGPHGFAIRLHLVVVTAHILHDLVDHELRVSPYVEALDARLDGDSEAVEEGLVLLHVIRRGEVQAHRVSHVLPKGRDEKQARTRSYLHH